VSVRAPLWLLVSLSPTWLLTQTTSNCNLFPFVGCRDTRLHSTTFSPTTPSGRSRSQGSNLATPSTADRRKSVHTPGGGPNSAPRSAAQRTPAGKGGGASIRHVFCVQAPCHTAHKDLHRVCYIVGMRMDRCTSLQNTPSLKIPLPVFFKHCTAAMLKDTRIYTSRVYLISSADSISQSHMHRCSVHGLHE